MKQAKRLVSITMLTATAFAEMEQNKVTTNVGRDLLRSDRDGCNDCDPCLLQGIKQQIEKGNRKIEEGNEKMNEIKQKLEKSEDDREGLQTSIDDLSKDLGRLKADVNEQNEAIAEILTVQGQQDAEIATIGITIEDIEEKVNELPVFSGEEGISRRLGAPVVISRSSN